MATDDDFDDGFEEILRDTPESRLPPCAMTCATLGRSDGARQARRVTVTFRVDRLHPEVVDVLSRPRFNVAFNQSARAIRILAVDDGRFQLSRAPRGEHTFLLRFPFPPRGMRWCRERVAVEPDVNVERGSIILDLPVAFHPEVEAPPRLPPPRPAPAIPPPAPARPPQPIPRYDEREDVRHMQRTLGLTPDFPRHIGTEYFPPAEAAILEVLYRRERVNREGLRMATRDPTDPGDDDRDEKIVDTYLCKMRPKLRDLGIEIVRDGTGSWTLAAQGKARLREHVLETHPNFT